MASSYEVITQVPTTDIGPTGTIVRATEITFTARPSGIVGKVTVPKRNPSADEAAPYLEDAAANIEAVQSL